MPDPLPNVDWDNPLFKRQKNPPTVKGPQRAPKSSAVSQFVDMLFQLDSGMGGAPFSSAAKRDQFKANGPDYFNPYKHWSPDQVEQLKAAIVKEYPRLASKADSILSHYGFAPAAPEDQSILRTGADAATVPKSASPAMTILGGP